MFDLSWSEILVIGTAAIIFIGPKELPGALRAAGQWAAKARAMAREFQTSVDDMIRESELEKIKTEVDKISGGGLQQHIERTIDPEGDINKALNAPTFTEPSAPPAPSSADAAPSGPPPSEPPPSEPLSGPVPPAPPVAADVRPAEASPSPDAPHKPT
ncbi:MAG TPA: Sec-independent protein translocase protein TatB [Alphaproteobacteria bacterium]